MKSLWENRSLFWIRKKLYTAAWKLGLYLPLDRRVLEETIFPRYQGDPDIRRILFVGVRKYCAHYPSFFRNQTYMTLDPDPKMARYGGPRHLIIRLEEMGSHFEPEFFDLIIVNGVFGWHIRRKEDLEQALSACYGCLRRGGELILGMNDEIHPIDFHSLKSFGGFDTFREHQIVIPSPFCKSHTYYFYRKIPSAPTE